MAEALTRLITEIPKGEASKAERVKQLVCLGVEEYSPWAERALKGRRYYNGNQWDDIATSQHKNRLHLVHNVCTDDLDKKIARLIEAEPIMEAHGRGAEDFELGAAWQDFLEYCREWTGEFHDSVMEIRRKAWTDMHVTGEGFEWPSWCGDEENGLGMVVSDYVDPFHIIWHKCKSDQLRDARYMAKFEPIEIALLEQEFPRWKGKFASDVPGFFSSLFDQAQDEHYRTASLAFGQGGLLAQANEDRAYRIEFWEKRWKNTERYMLDGRPAMTRTPAGENIFIDREKFEKLSTEQKKRLEKVDIRDYELWQTIMVNEFILEERIAKEDTTFNGHGHFPIARYTAGYDPNNTHAKGQVEPLFAYQDYINQVMSYGLETLFIGNGLIVDLQRGAYPRAEEAKIQRFGEQAVQVMRRYPGQPPVQFLSAPPTSFQMWQQSVDWLSTLKDKQSQVTDVHRAAPQYEMSGKAINSLMAEADLSGTKLRKAVESGLAHAEMLRIALIQQNMRVNRMIRVTQKAQSAGYGVVLAQTEESAIKSHRLTKQTDERTGEKSFATPTGEKRQVLVLSDADIRKFDLRLKLDTDKERNQAENMNLVAQLLQYAGPGGGPGVIKWAAELMDTPNLEQLFSALDTADSQAKVVQQIKQIEEETGMTLQDFAQMAQAMKAQKEGKAPPGAPQGPQGPPQGQPQAPQGPPEGPSQ